MNNPVYLHRRPGKHGLADYQFFRKVLNRMAGPIGRRMLARMSVGINRVRMWPVQDRLKLVARLEGAQRL